MRYLYLLWSIILAPSILLSQSITFTADNWPSELELITIDFNGVEIYSFDDPTEFWPGGAGSSTTLTLQFGNYTPVGDYTVTIMDSFGDGAGDFFVSSTDPYACVGDCSGSSNGSIYTASFSIINLIGSGCTDPEAANYDSEAVTDDGSCLPSCANGDTMVFMGVYGSGPWDSQEYQIFSNNELAFEGLLDVDAIQENDTICLPWNSCIKVVVAPSFAAPNWWMTSPLLNLPNDYIFSDDGGGTIEFFLGDNLDAENCGCTDESASNYNSGATFNNGTCIYPGCMHPGACNYDTGAIEDDGSCEFDSCAGCMEPTACNYDSSFTIEYNESCEYVTCVGCMDTSACNFDSTATIEANESFCMYLDDWGYCDGECIGSIDACGICNGPGAIYDCGCADIPNGECDCEGNQLDALGVCGGDCTADVDNDGICDDIDDCVGEYDACGICNGPGAIYDCGCADIPNGECDCEGNQLDALGVCGGDCTADVDNDGICDDIDDCVGEYDACGICNGPGAIYQCGCAPLLIDACDCFGNQLDECGVCGGDGASCATTECLDQDEVVQPLGGCINAVSLLGCGALWDGMPISQLCPVTCSSCLCDHDFNNNGICDENETLGCTYPSAINFSESATTDDGSCILQPIDTCPNDVDGDGQVGVGDILSVLTVYGNTCLE
jgi:hypothetical protein